MCPLCVDFMLGKSPVPFPVALSVPDALSVLVAPSVPVVLSVPEALSVEDEVVLDFPS
jgi:hypothetical protein